MRRTMLNQPRDQGTRLSAAVGRSPSQFCHSVVGSRRKTLSFSPSYEPLRLVTPMDSLMAQ